jgi:hypothetical protein
LARQLEEDGLRHVLRDLRGTDSASRRGVNEIQMPAYEFGERLLRAVLGKTLEQFPFIHGAIMNA